MAEPLLDPDQGWTSDRELDRLAPLAESLHYWSEVYDRWRSHELAATRPEQARFSRADLTAIDDLRGVHFGWLAAASRRLRQVGEAAAQLAESAGLAGSELAHAWPGGASQRWETLQRDMRDCAARCTDLGFVLEVAVIETVAPVITSAVREILARAGGLDHSAGCPSRELCAQRITELSLGSARDAEPPEVHRVWRAELDRLVTDYDAVLGLLRATLAEARATVTRIYQAAVSDIVPSGAVLSGEPGPATAPSQVARTGDAFPGTGAGGTGQADGLAPASTMLASVGLTGDTGSADGTGPAAGSSSASGGGRSDLAAVPVPTIPGAPDPGSAVLGNLGESRSPGPGGAVLGSVPGTDVQYSGSVQRSTGAEYGTGGVASWGPMYRDQERKASWARLQALLGEQASGPAEPDQPPGR